MTAAAARLPLLRGITLPERLRLLATAAGVLALSVTTALTFREVPRAIEGLATKPVSTAFLGTATCADWHHFGTAQRSTAVSALALAATGPDPENAGATLQEGAAFGLFQRACSTRASRSALLYEIYNRAAAFQPVASAPIVRPGGFGSAPRR